jgi:hypothetical protein
LHASARTLLRTFLALLAVVALAGACGSDKKDEADATTTTRKPKATTTSISEDSVCSLLELDALSNATGENFVNAEADADNTTCTYSNANDSAAIALNLGSYDGTAADALTGARAQCDAGSDAELTFENSEGGFSCLRDGIPLVAAVNQGAIVVLSGKASNENITNEQVIEALHGVLQDAINEE